MLSVIFCDLAGTSRYALLRPCLTPHAAASPSQLCSLKQISPCTPPRAGIARFTLAGGSMLYKTMLPALCKAFTCCICDGAGSLDGQDGFYRTSSGPGRLRAALYRMHPTAGDGGIRLNSTGSPCCGRHPGIRSHRFASEQGSAPHPPHAIEQFHHCRKGCATSGAARAAQQATKTSAGKRAALHEPC